MANAPVSVVAGPVGNAPRHSLLTAAVDATNEAVRAGDPAGSGADIWVNGFEYESEPCGGVTAWDPRCSVDEGDRGKSDPADPLRLVQYRPFVLETAVRCSTSGADFGALQDRALLQVELGTAKGLENELWTGAKMGTVNPSFVRGIPETSPGANDEITATVLSATAENVQTGIVRLSTALAECGTGVTGTIHLPVSVGLAAMYEEIIKEDADGVLRTARGDVVVIGSGYTGAGPTGSAAPGDDQGWIFATGAVKYRKSNAWASEMRESLDRDTNTYVVRGERAVAAYFGGCCFFATLVDWAATTNEGA